MKINWPVGLMAILACVLSVTSYAQNLPVIQYEPDTLSASVTVCGDTLHLPLTLSNQGSGMLLFGVKQEIQFYDDFESGLDNWVSNGKWGLSSVAYQGSYSITESPEGKYGKNWAYYIQLRDSLEVYNSALASLSFFMRISMNYDYFVSFSVQISVNNASWQSLRSFSYQDPHNWTQYSFDLSNRVKTGDCIRIRFYFYSSGSVTGYDGFNIDNFLVSGVGSYIPWLSFPVNSGVLQPGQSTQFDVVFDAAGLTSGTYRRTLNIETNDPGNPLLLVPCILTLTGLPLVKPGDTLLDFGSIMQFATETRTLKVRNEGCAPLIFGSFITTSDVFSFDKPPDTIPPGDSTIFPMYFTPDSSGIYSDTLFMATNNGVHYVLLAGEASGAPILGLDPDSLYRLVSCGVPDSTELNLVNQGSTALEYILHHTYTEDFECGLGNWAANGEWGISTPEYWNSQCLTANMQGFTGMYWDFSIEMKSQLVAVDATNAYLSFYLYYSGWSYYGQYWCVQISVNAGDWVTLECSDAYTDWQEFGYDLGSFLSDGDYFRIRFLYQSDMFINDACLYIDDILVMGACQPWLVCGLSSGSIPAGQNIAVQVIFDPGSINAGIYDQQLIIETNEPVVNRHIIDARMIVSGEPFIVLMDTTVYFDTIMAFGSIIKGISVTNTGCDTLWINGIGSDTSVFGCPPAYPLYVLPHDTVPVPALFTPAAPGAYEGTLSIFNNSSTVNITAFGFATDAPVMVIDPDSVYMLMQTCNDTVYSNFTISNEGFAELAWNARPRDKAGTALGCYNHDQRVDIGYMGAFPSRGTIELWLTSQDYDGDQVCFLSTAANGLYNGIGLRRMWGQSLFLYIYDEIGNYGCEYEITSQMTCCEWHHVAVTWDVDQQKVWAYFDGVLEIAGWECWAWPSEIPDLMIGSGFLPDSPWVGDLDEIRMWSVIRSHDEILSTMNHSLLGNETGLWAYWPANEGSGSQLYDMSGNGHNSTYCGAMWLNSSVPIRTLMSVNPESGTVAPGESISVETAFYGNNLPAGKYDPDLMIWSNDPQKQYGEIPCTLELDGAVPPIYIENSTKYFGQVMVGQSRVDSFKVYNFGCDTAFMYEVTFQNFPDVFSVSPFPLVILPWQNAYLHITFQPDQPVFYQETIGLNTNAGPMVAFAEGEGTSTPEISATPDTLFITLSHDDTVTDYLWINNYNGEWELTGFVSLMEDATINTSAMAICQEPGWGYCQYEDECYRQGISKVRLEEINQYSADANTAYEDFTQTQPAILCQGHSYLLSVYTTFSAIDHDVEAWIDYNNDGLFVLSERIMFSEDDIMHYAPVTIPENAAKGVPLRLRISAHTSIGYYTSQTEDYAVIADPGLRPLNPGFTVLPGEDTQIELQFSSHKLLNGTHVRNIFIHSNDPEHPVISIPCYLVVTGSDLAFSGNPVEFGGVMVHDTVSRLVTMTNYSPDTLNIFNTGFTNANFGSSGVPSLLNPGQQVRVSFTFSPDTSGYAEGYYLLFTGSGTDSLMLTGYGTAAPAVSLEPDSLAFSQSCDDTASLAFTMINSGDADLSFSINHCQTLDDSLQCHYTFNGNCQDVSGHGRHFVNYGAVLSSGKNEVENESYFFDNSGMKYSSWPDIQKLWSPFITVSLWLKIPDTADWSAENQVFFNLGDNENLYVSPLIGLNGIRIYADANTMGGIFSIDFFDYSLSQPVAINEWTHLAFTFDGHAFRMFLNGVQTAVVSAEGRLTYARTALEIGRQSLYNNVTYFTGKLDDIRIYNRSLDPQEIHWIYLLEKTLSGLTFTASSGIINPGSNDTINVVFNSLNFHSGDYQSSVPVFTNDPLHKVTFIGAGAEITGIPELVADTVYIHFDTLRQFTFARDSVTLDNPSCTAIQVSDINTHDDIFIPSDTTMIIEPYSSRILYVTYHGSDPGINLDTLFIMSNAGATQITLEGYCTASPAVSAFPGRLSQIASCFETLTDSIRIYNTGSSFLECSFWHSPAITWLTVPSGTISVGPGEDTSIPVGFNRTGLNVGLYSSLIKIFSNDPLNPSLRIPVYLLVATPLDPVYLGNDSSYCVVSGLVLDAGDFESYLWNDGSSGRQITVDTSGTYWVRVLDIHGCYSSDTISLSIYNAPVASTGNDTIACSGINHQLTGTATNLPPGAPLNVKIGGGSSFYSWSPNPFGTNYTDNRTVMLYAGEEIIAAGLIAGNITALGIIVSSPGSPGMHDFHIRMGSTQLNAVQGFVPGLTEVFYSNYYQVAPGTNWFELQQPWYWDGNSNVLVEICFDNSGWQFSSYVEYTNVPGTVWGRSCNNCAPGCNLGGGNSGPWRPNLIIRGQHDFTNYSWAGPAGFSSTLKNPVIPSITPLNAGNYVFIVDNGYGCADSSVMSISVIESPVITLDPDTTLLEGDTFTLQASVTGGFLPYSYAWSPSAGLSSDTILNPACFATSTTAYTLTVTGQNNCPDIAGTTVTVIPRYSVSGQLYYDNPYFSALPQSVMHLKTSAGLLLDSVETDQNGNYVFPLVVNGGYVLESTTEILPGGINASDALAIATHLVYIKPISGLRLLAADVNHSMSVSSADALLVLHRTVGNILTFTPGDWYFESPQFTVNGSNVVKNVRGICYGDVNASYIPMVKWVNNTELRMSGVCRPDGGGRVLIPLTTLKPVAVAAATVELVYLPGVLTVTDVTAPGGHTVFNTGNTFLSVAWYNVESKHLGTGDTLFLIHAQLNENLSLPAEPRFLLGNKTEFCDISGEVLSHSLLGLPAGIVRAEDPAASYISPCHPNPADDFASMYCYLPEGGLLTFGMYNSTGQLIYSKNYHAFSGTFRVDLDCSRYPSGLYTVIVSFTGGETQQVSIQKIIINH